MSTDRVTLPVEDAILLLPDSETIHTFRNAGMILVGCDWDRSKIVEAMERYGVELAGETAASMNHGLCLNDGSWLFIQTRPNAEESQ